MIPGIKTKRILLNINKPNLLKTKINIEKPPNIKRRKVPIASGPSPESELMIFTEDINITINNKIKFRRLSIIFPLFNKSF
jgi:hypothetical protein